MTFNSELSAIFRRKKVEKNLKIWNLKFLSLAMKQSSNTRRIYSTDVFKDAHFDWRRKLHHINRWIWVSHFKLMNVFFSRIFFYSITRWESQITSYMNSMLNMERFTKKDSPNVRSFSYSEWMTKKGTEKEVKFIASFYNWLCIKLMLIKKIPQKAAIILTQREANDIDIIDFFLEICWVSPNGVPITVQWPEIFFLWIIYGRVIFLHGAV